MDTYLYHKSFYSTNDAAITHIYSSKIYMKNFQQTVFVVCIGDQLSDFLYRNSLRANQRLALTWKSVNIAQVLLCAVQQVLAPGECFAVMGFTPCMLCVQIYCVSCQKHIIWKGYELLVICIGLLPAEFSNVNTGSGRPMFWKARD